MTRGRKQRWICRECGVEFETQNITPKMCCFCGSTEIWRTPSVELAENYAQKTKELDEVCTELNRIFEKYQSLYSKYQEIMAYWKQQKKRGYITAEEYDTHAMKFIGIKRTTGAKKENEHG